MAPSASPVNPMPVSARKERRVIPAHAGDTFCLSWEATIFSLTTLTNSDEVVVVEQHQYQVLTGALEGLRLVLCVRQERGTEALFLGGGRASEDAQEGFGEEANRVRADL